MSSREIIRKIRELSYPPKHVNINNGRFNIIELLDKHNKDLINIINPIFEYIEENIDNIDNLLLMFRNGTYMIEILHDNPLTDIDKIINMIGNRYDIYVIYDKYMTKIYATPRKYEETVKILKELLNYGRPYALGIEYGVIHCSPLVTTRENIRNIIQILKKAYSYMDKLSIYVRGILINISYITDIDDILRLVEEICRTGTCNESNIIEFMFEGTTITEDSKIRVLPHELVHRCVQLLERYRIPVFRIYPHTETSGYEIYMIGSEEMLSKILSEISNITVVKTYEKYIGNMKETYVLVGEDENHVEKVRREYEEYEKKFKEEIIRTAEKVAKEYGCFQYDEDIEELEDYFNDEEEC
ncbi:MAG: hypothetical protein GXO26_08140 [Crenarchaeota archaeon]|nr:hypothetical protein [Thermoproteota archaeon]